LPFVRVIAFAFVFVFVLMIRVGGGEAWWLEGVRHFIHKTNWLE
jgi:hypothetical protein